MFRHEDELQDEIGKLKGQLHRWKSMAEILYKELEWCITNPACDDIELKQAMEKYNELKQQDT